MSATILMYAPLCNEGKSFRKFQIIVSQDKAESDDLCLAAFNTQTLCQAIY
jgi:hypothetical protein